MDKQSLKSSQSKEDSKQTPSNFFATTSGQIQMNINPNDLSLLLQKNQINQSSFHDSQKMQIQQNSSTHPKKVVQKMVKNTPDINIMDQNILIFSELLQRAQLKLSTNNIKESLQILLGIQEKLYNLNQCRKWIECLHTRITCQTIILKDHQKHSQDYLKLLDKAKLRSIELRGKIFAQNQIKMIKQIATISKQKKIVPQVQQILNLHTQTVLINMDILQQYEQLPIFHELKLAGKRNYVYAGIGDISIPRKTYCDWMLLGDLKKLQQQSVYLTRFNVTENEGYRLLAQKSNNYTSIYVPNKNIDIQKTVNIEYVHLRSLTLNNCQLGAKGCEYLCLGKWAQLNVLWLGFNNIQDQGCRFITKGFWPQLSILSLWKNSIRDKGCKHLRKGNWPQITRLQLSTNQIGNQGCKHLTNSRWPVLSELYLNQNLIEQEGCKLLVKGNWAQLRELDLRTNLTPYEQWDMLEEMFSQTELTISWW